MVFKLDTLEVNEECLIDPVKVEPYYDGFQYEEDYVDTGRQDILRKVLKTPIEYEGKTIIAYCFADRYQYGYDNNTMKRMKLVLYYN